MLLTKLRNFFSYCRKDITVLANVLCMRKRANIFEKNNNNSKESQATVFLSSSRGAWSWGTIVHFLSSFSADKVRLRLVTRQISNSTFLSDCLLRTICQWTVSSFTYSSSRFSRPLTIFWGTEGILLSKSDLTREEKEFILLTNNYRLRAVAICLQR